MPKINITNAKIENAHIIMKAVNPITFISSLRSPLMKYSAAYFTHADRKPKCAYEKNMVKDVQTLYIPNSILLLDKCGITTKSDANPNRTEIVCQIYV